MQRRHQGFDRLAATQNEEHGLQRQLKPQRIGQLQRARPMPLVHRDDVPGQLLPERVARFTQKTRQLGDAPVAARQQQGEQALGGPQRVNLRHRPRGMQRDQAVRQGGLAGQRFP